MFGVLPKENKNRRPRAGDNETKVRWRRRASEGRAPPSPLLSSAFLHMLAIAPATASGAEGTGGDEHSNTALGDSLTSWGCQPIAKLKGTLLEWSTVDEVSGRARNTKRKQCLFCGFHFTGGPFQIRCHIDPAVVPRTIRACKPTAAWQERHVAVLSLV